MIRMEKGPDARRNMSKLTNTKGEKVWHHVQNAVPKL